MALMENTIVGKINIKHIVRHYSDQSNHTPHHTLTNTAQCWGIYLNQDSSNLMTTGRLIKFPLPCCATYNSNDLFLWLLHTAHLC